LTALGNQQHLAAPARYFGLDSPAFADLFGFGP
jgi:hypothetical protein